MYPLSPVKATVGRLCEKLKTRQETVGDKIYGGSFAGFFSFADAESSQRTGKCMYIKRGRTKGISLAAQSRAVAGGGKAPVSTCKPLYAILLRKPSVYPLSPVKANVDRLCEKLKTGINSGL